MAIPLVVHKNENHSRTPHRILVASLARIRRKMKEKVKYMQERQAFNLSTTRVQREIALLEKEQKKISAQLHALRQTLS